MTPLPSFIDPDAWAAFLEQKADGLRKKRKRLTPAMEKLLLSQCYRLKAAGHDVKACIEWSTLMGYDSIWPDNSPKLEAVTNQAESTAQFLAERAAIKADAPPPELRALANKLRRVA